MKCLFFALFISSKCDSHVGAERMRNLNSEKCQELSASIFLKKKKLMARKIFRRDIYRSHPTIKVAQYYYFSRVTLGVLGCRYMIFLRSAFNFRGIPEVPHHIFSSVR